MTPQNTDSTAPTNDMGQGERQGAATLVLVASSTGPGSIGPETPLLGLTLAGRAAKAARKAGYAATLVMGTDLSGLAGLGQGRVIIAPAGVLAEAAWLKAAMEAEVPNGGWAALPSRIAILDSDSARPAFQAVSAQGPDWGFESLERHMTESLGAPAALPDLDVLVLQGQADLPGASRRLLRALVKDTDGFMARVFARPISIAVSRRLAPLGVTPNQMTLVSMLIGLASAPFFLSAEPGWQVLGALLFIAHSVLDGCDGELARLTYHETRLGGLLDFASDNLVHVAVFACMALGWSAAEGASWPLLFGTGAVAGTAGSAFAVYWLTLRRKKAGGPVYTSVTTGKPSLLSKLLDELSRRDFIYLVLGFAVFGKAQWFVALSGVGAPIFFLALLFALGVRRAPV